MTKSYSLQEIHQNRLRIKSIPKNVKFLEIYKICASFGELMYFNVLSCSRSLVYVSFVNRTDAFSALNEINNDTLMEASFSNEFSDKYSKDDVFVLDLTALEDCEKNRLVKRKRIRHRNRKNREFMTKQFEKDFDIYPNYYSTDSNSEVLVNDEKIEQLISNEQEIIIKFSYLDFNESSSNVRITHSLSDWESTESLSVLSDHELVRSSHQSSSKKLIEKYVEFDEENLKELKPMMSLTSWSIFNGKPKDWTKLRLPTKKILIDYFPSLKEKPL